MKNLSEKITIENVLKVVGGVVVVAAAATGIILTAEQMPEDAGELVFTPIEEWELFIR